MDSRLGIMGISNIDVNYFKPIKERRDNGYERGDIRNFFNSRGSIDTEERVREERGSQKMNGRGRPPERRR